MTDLLRHFFSRGHEGRVTCVDASAAADFVVSGGVDYTVRLGGACRRTMVARAKLLGETARCQDVHAATICS